MSRYVIGRAAWPDVALAEDVFARFVAAIDPPPPEAHAADLYLACACAERIPTALAAFDKSCLAQVGTFVAHVDRSTAFADEVRQQLREKLFVAGKIRDYAGRGALGGWVRVAAVRTALNVQRGRKSPTPEPGEAATGDPELDYMKLRYRDEFRAVVDAVFAALSSDERAVLRMHYLDGLGIDELAKVFSVHRATVARWIAASREAVLSGTRTRLAERHNLAGDELDSLMRLVGSQLDVSIHRLLQTPKPSK